MENIIIDEVHHQVSEQLLLTANLLEQIKGPDGSVIYAAKPGENVDKCRQQTCLICQQYTNKEINMQWRCKDCGMSLCQLGRKNPLLQWLFDCIEEQKSSDDKVIGCGLMYRTSFKMHDDLRITTAPTQAMSSEAKDGR